MRSTDAAALAMRCIDASSSRASAPLHSWRSSSSEMVSGFSFIIFFRHSRECGNLANKKTGSLLSRG